MLDPAKYFLYETRNQYTRYIDLDLSNKEILIFRNILFHERLFASCNPSIF